jgi:alpha-N-acetylglucosamine transferase
MNNPGFAYVSLLTHETNYNYVYGAAVHAMQITARSRYPYLILVTPNITERTRQFLQANGAQVREVEPIEADSIKASRYRFAYSKLRVYSLTEYKRILFLDLDMLLMNELDELFELPEGFYAVADWALNKVNYFNSGLFLANPDAEVFGRMVEALERDSRDDGFGDQGFLNYWYNRNCRWIGLGFAGWRRLPYEYNATHLIHWQHKSSIKAFIGIIRMRRIPVPYRYNRTCYPPSYRKGNIQVVHEKLWAGRGLEKFEQAWKHALSQLVGASG